jgi:hypothetical protein
MKNTQIKESISQKEVSYIVINNTSVRNLKTLEGSALKHPEFIALVL